MNVELAAAAVVEVVMVGMEMGRRPCPCSRNATGGMRRV